MTFVLSILCSVSSGILSQRMFVMLPCGGVGVRENSHTAPKCSKALNDRDIKKKKNRCAWWKTVLFQRRATGPTRCTGFHQRQDIKEEKRVWSAPRLPDSPCETMTIALIWPTCSWPGIKEKKPSDFTVRARWTVMHNVWSQWSIGMDLVQKHFFLLLSYRWEFEHPFFIEHPLLTFLASDRV